MTEEAGNNCVFENVGYNKKIAPYSHNLRGLMLDTISNNIISYFLK